MTTGQDLTERVRQGDGLAFAELFETHADRLYRLASAMLGDAAEAEDVVQQAFLALLTHCDRFEGRSALGTWLYRVAYNACVDRLRTRQAVPMEPLDEESLPMPVSLARWDRAPDERLIDEQARRLLAAAIRSIPESLRAVFLLRDVEELSTADTAEALGISPGAVKVRLHRARLLLRERLAAEFGRP